MLTVTSDALFKSFCPIVVVSDLPLFIELIPTFVAQSFATTTTPASELATQAS